MSNDLSDYLSRKAANLHLERGEQLASIQAQLDELYPEQCRAVSINDGILKITTKNASVASELRLSQHKLMRQLKVTKLYIIIS